MTGELPRADAGRCFVCGPHNPIGLRLSFAVEGESCHGTYTSTPDHVGFDGVTHGGIVFSVLDDAMANWFFLQGARGYTAKAEIRYRAPMPVGELTFAMRSQAAPMARSPSIRCLRPRSISRSLPIKAGI